MSLVREKEFVVNVSPTTVALVNCPLVIFLMMLNEHTTVPLQDSWPQESKVVS